jgi:hypothetical protein
VEASIRCETFGLSPEAMPNLDTMLAAADPDKMVKLYRDAGLNKLADNAEPMRRSAKAEQHFNALPNADYELYAQHLPQTIRLEDCLIPPPEAALSVLVAVKEARLFDSMVVLTSTETRECLLLGLIRVGTSFHRFKIAQWGFNLTSIQQLRKRHPLRDVAKYVSQLFSGWRWPRLGGSGEHGWAYFGAITVLAALPAWLFLLPISWWLFAGGLAAGLGLAGFYTHSQTDYCDTERSVVGTLAALNAVAAVIVGIIHLVGYFTDDRTEEVLVCNVERQDEWVIHTPNGPRALEGGFYNGTYYPARSEVAAKLLLGQWVRVTEHGRDMGDGRVGIFVTGADTLRPGSCG